MADPEKQEAILSQAEVDSLLTGLPEGPTGEKEVVEKLGEKTVRPYHFHTSAYLSEGKLRRVKNKHEDLSNSLTVGLSQFLRTEFSIRLTNLETIPHKTMVDTLKGPTHLKLIRVEPSKQIGLLEVSPMIGLGVVARLLGAKGRSEKTDRPFTEIELSLLGGFTDVILETYSLLCRNYEPHWRMISMENETSAQFLKIASENAPIFLLTFEGKFSDATGQIRLALPQSAIDPLIKKITEEVPVDAPVSAAAPAPVKSSQGVTMDFPIPVHARWSGLQIALREVASLKKDDVLMLDPNIFGQTSLCVGESAKFVGQIGKKGTSLAIRITSTV